MSHLSPPKGIMQSQLNLSLPSSSKQIPPFFRSNKYLFSITNRVADYHIRKDLSVPLNDLKSKVHLLPMLSSGRLTIGKTQHILSSTKIQKYNHTLIRGLTRGQCRCFFTSVVYLYIIFLTPGAFSA